MKSKNQMTPNSKATKMLTAVGIDPEKAPEIKKKVAFCRGCLFRDSMCWKRKEKPEEKYILSGKILKKYKLLSYTRLA